MGCCGQKRQALAREELQIEENSAEESSVVGFGVRKRPAAAKFYYTGSGTLLVDGLFARNVYRFSSAVRELMIAAEDVSIVRGYPELTELKG